MFDLYNYLSIYLSAKKKTGVHEKCGTCVLAIQKLPRIQAKNCTFSRV